MERWPQRPVRADEPDRWRVDTGRLHAAHGQSGEPHATAPPLFQSSPPHYDCRRRFLLPPHASPNMRVRQSLPRAFIVGIALLAAVPSRAAAQDSEVVPAVRMKRFMRALLTDSLDLLLPFFPRQGDWSWVQAWSDEHEHPLPAGTWRFPAASTRQVLDHGGPACESFDLFPEGGEFGAPPGLLSEHVRYDSMGWRRVRGNRFVPPGAKASSPVFVEWRREGREWVISRFGDEQMYFPHLAGEEIGTIMRDTLLRLPLNAYAANERWYVNNDPISFDGNRYVKYGLPRQLGDEDWRLLVRIGRAGRVPVYAERDVPKPPEVIYIPTGPGEAQAYEGFLRPSCR